MRNAKPGNHLNRLTPENVGSYLRVFTAFHNRGQQIQLYIISLIKSTVLHIKSKFSPVTMWRHTGSDGSVTDKHMKTIEMAPRSCLVILVSSWIIGMQNHSKMDVTKLGRSKSAIGFMNKTTTLHVHHGFLYISLPSLQNYEVKYPNFALT